VRALAESFLDKREVRPGVDYALTEVVHCKSRDEAGVASAVTVCAPLYLRRVIALSPARLIVVLGGHARNAVRRTFNYPDPGRISRPLRVGRRDLRFVFLAHPSAGRTRVEYPKQLPAEELVVAQRLLARASRR
jgi:uracil-DNA glycosylase